MLNKLLLFAFSFFYILTSNAQVNITVAGHLNYQTLHETNLSDVLGYVDEAGNEYALVGMTEGGISVVDISDPENMTEVFSTGGPASNWYEIKVWNDYAYVTTEGGGGLIIIDLSPLPGNTNLTVSHFTTGGWSTAHNLWIDENGILYIFGANRGVGGAIIYDLNIDATDLTEVGFWNEYYVHDAIVIGDTMYAAHIHDGFFSIYDVSDKANPVYLASANTPNNWTHNIWVNDNRTRVFTTDEVGGAYIAEYDISDFQNITETDRIQSSPGELVIPHNAYYLSNDYVISSYFNDGVILYDVSQPGNMVEVGHYDTSPYSGTGFTGVWGVYLGLPSGNIIAGDVTEGLFILSPNYVRGAYLEGTVTDQLTTNPIPNVSIEILEPDDVDHSQLNGEYRMGTAQIGSYTIVFAKPAYRSDTIYDVALANGTITTLDVQLEPLVPFSFSGTVTQLTTGTPVDSAIVRIENYQYYYEVYTDENGDFNIPGFYEGEFEINIGKWEYHTVCFNELLIDGSNNVLNVELEKGLYEDFTFDNGWVATASATRGLWEYGKPFGTFFGPISLHPNTDSPDCGGFAYTSGNDGNIYNEVDGTITLTSPVFDATYISDPYISYYRWFFNANLNTATEGNDTMKIMLNNGSETVIIEKIHAYTSVNTLWNLHSERISDYLTPTSTMQFIVQVSDPSNVIDDQTEAGIDGVQITATSIGVEEHKSSAVLVYPNPTTEFLTIELADRFRKCKLEVMDLTGHIVLEVSNINDVSKLDISSFNSGIYCLRISSPAEIYSTKLVKL
jgi:choice-of-anchor B domain-containing protein